MGEPAIVWHNLVRICALIVAIVLIRTGYKLFDKGIDRGGGELSFSMKGIITLFFTGTGSGLFFMAFGAIITIVVLFTGQSHTKSNSFKYLDYEQTSEEIKLQNLFNELSLPNLSPKNPDAYLQLLELELKTEEAEKLIRRLQQIQRILADPNELNDRPPPNIGRQ